MSLLQLPTHVRLKIYAYAGAPSIGAPHHCYHDSDPSIDTPRADNLDTLFDMLFPNYCPVERAMALSDIINIDLNHRPAATQLSSQNSITLSLLLSCSVIYTELAHFIYSNFQIVIRAKDDSSLAVLRNLRITSISSLKRLTIDLNSTSCGHGWACEDRVGSHPVRIGQDFGAEKDDVRDDAHVESLSITDYSRSQPLTITNELHKVSAEALSSVSRY